VGDLWRRLHLFLDAYGFDGNRQSFGAVVAAQAGINAAGLTARNLTVLTLLAERLTSTEITDRLHPSWRTVDNHVNAILAKLAVPSQRRAVMLAIDWRWLPVVRHAQI
jgi:DNA-binding NarL/FixJ family response regulator